MCFTAEMVEDFINQNQRGKLWHSRQPGICPICRRMFSNKFNLKQHIINIHTAGGDVECQQCKKKCKNKWYLRRHQVTHHGAPLRKNRQETSLQFAWSIRIVAHRVQLYVVPEKTDQVEYHGAPLRKIRAHFTHHYSLCDASIDGKTAKKTEEA